MSQEEINAAVRKERVRAREERFRRRKRQQTQRIIVTICVLLLCLLGISAFVRTQTHKDVKKESSKYEHLIYNTLKEKEEGEVTTPTPTPEATPTPDVSQIDTTTIESVYNPNMDKTGLEEIDQSALGDVNQIEYLKGLTPNGNVMEIINGTTYVDGLLIVNKTYSLPADYVPKNAYIDLTGIDYSVYGINTTAYDAYLTMQEDAAAEGLSIEITSGYRSYDTQAYLFNDYTSRDGKEMADTYSSRAGHSEHQSSLCFDLNSINDSFTDTPEGIWIDENCWKYGFCIRFPEGKTEYTGYKYESWHLRYVGTELAEILYNGGDWISLEEYFGLTSAYYED